MHTELPEFDMPADEQVNLAAESFRMLADPTRIKVLWALLQGESSVACLADLAGAAPTAVSQHLAKLRLAGLVTGRREGTFVYYSAANDHVRSLLSQALFHADHVDRDIPADPATPHVHQPAVADRGRSATLAPGTSSEGRRRV
jgi:DNA-binding transcriptional ArsR family regulator